jgi:hypothetical protein
MITNKKPANSFTNEEIAKLMPYINGTLRFNPQIAKVIATELSKTTYSVYQYVRKQKSAFKQLGRVKRNYNKRTKTDKSVVADKSVVKTFNTLKHGEFIIPVKSFEIRNDNGVTNLVLKFN